MISQAEYHGRCFHATASVNSSAPAGYRVYIFTANVPGLTVTIPTALAFNKGFAAFVVGNVSTVNAIQVNDRAGGTLVASLAAGQWALLSCLGNTTQAGSWAVSLRTRLT